MNEQIVIASLLSFDRCSKLSNIKHVFSIILREVILYNKYCANISLAHSTCPLAQATYAAMSHFVLLLHVFY